MNTQKIKIVLLAKSGNFSDQTLLHISNHFKIDYIIFEFKTRKEEIKTFVKTQGRIRFAFFILTTILRKLKINKSQSVEFDRIKYCQDQNIPYQIVNNHNSIESITALNKVNPDLIVICSSGIISQKIIDIPKIGVINGHPGWLPDFRGWDALRWAVLKDGVKGVTIHFIDKGIDTGDIVLQEKINSGTFKNFSRLFNFALKLRLDLYIKAIGLVNTGEYPRIKQTKKAQSLYKRMSFWKQLQVNFLLNKNFKKQEKR